MNHIALELRDVHFRKKTGRLVFKRGETQKYFFFQEGVLIRVKTNQPDERLGEILFKLERITQPQFADIDRFIEPNRNLGDVLVAKQVIGPQDLADALLYQMRESVLNTFPAFDAQLSFQPQDGFDGPPGDVKMQVPFLIEYGIRRMDFDPELAAFLGPRTFGAGKRTFIYLLSEDERAVLERLQGGLTADQVRTAQSSSPDVFWKTVYLLYALGLVELKDFEKEPPPKSSQPSRPHAGAAAAAPGRGTGAPGAAADPESPQARLGEVLALRQNLSSKNHYQVLGLGREASADDVKKTYFQLARRYHPDKFDRATSTAYRTQIEEVFNAVTNAYRVLIDPAKRKAYDGSPAPAAPSPAQDAQDAQKRADLKYRQGRQLHSQARYKEALVVLEEAVRLRKNKADYFIQLALTESKFPDLVRKAEEDLLKAVALEPWSGAGYLQLGLLYKKEGLFTKAVRYLQKAVEVEPDSAAAQAELRKMEGDEKKGWKDLLKLDFLGKKKK